MSGPELFRPISRSTGRTPHPDGNPAIRTLASAACVRRGQPLCLIGDSGTGKSHLLIGLGTAAAEAGFRVRYTLATRLVNELVEAADDKTLAKTIARYGRVDPLCIDELGYMALDRRGANSARRTASRGYARGGWCFVLRDLAALVGAAAVFSPSCLGRPCSCHQANGP